MQSTNALISWWHFLRASRFSSSSISSSSCFPSTNYSDTKGKRFLILGFKLAYLKKRCAPWLRWSHQNYEREKKCEPLFKGKNDWFYVWAREMWWKLDFFRWLRTSDEYIANTDRRSLFSPASVSRSSSFSSFIHSSCIFVRSKMASTAAAPAAAPAPAPVAAAPAAPALAPAPVASSENAIKLFNKW